MEERLPRSSRIEIGVGVVIAGLQFLFPTSTAIGRSLLAVGILLIAHGVFPDLFRFTFWTQARRYCLFIGLYFAMTTWAVTHPPVQFHFTKAPSGLAALPVAVPAPVAPPTALPNAADASLQRAIDSLRADLIKNTKSGPPEKQKLFISEGKAVEILTLLWSSEPQDIAIYHGATFEGRSLYSQVENLFTISRWKISAEITQIPTANPTWVIVEGPSPDNKKVLLLERMFSIAGIETKFQATKNTIPSMEVVLHLP